MKTLEKTLFLNILDRNYVFLIFVIVFVMCSNSQPTDRSTCGGRKWAARILQECFLFDFIFEQVPSDGHKMVLARVTPYSDLPCLEVGLLQ